MTFERLANAGLSLGLSISDILELPIGFTMGLINDRNNQTIEAKKEKKSNDDVVQGDARMLMSL